MVVPKRAKNGKVEDLMDGEVTATSIKSTLFTGNLTGDVTGSLSGTAAVATQAMSVEPAACAGTIVGLTAAFGAPAGLSDGSLFVIKDSADANKIKVVAVIDDAFYIGAAMTAAA